MLLAVVLVSWACGNEGASPPDDAGLADADGTESPDAENVQVAVVGGTCEILTDAGPAQGVFNAEALECPSRICLKPAVQPGASAVVDTAAFCSTICSQDSDCEGQLRDATNDLDKRCSQGFVCGLPFVKGRLCCQRLCLCKDFLGPNGAPTPIACQGAAAVTCNE
jgi:hypothetical protein